MGTPPWFSSIFTKDNNFCDFQLHCLNLQPFQKGIYCYRKKNPRGVDSFLHQLTPTKKGGRNESIRVASPCKCTCSSYIWRNCTCYNSLHKLWQACTISYICCRTGPSFSKLTTSLVNVSLKFQTLISQMYQYFLLKKCEKLLQCKSFSHFFNKKYHCIWL